MTSPKLTFCLELIKGLDIEWFSFLKDLAKDADPNNIIKDWDDAESPLPRQLRNPAVIKEFTDGRTLVISSQIWLVIDDEGNRSIIEPEETSGIVTDENGKVKRRLAGLPSLAPKNTKYLVRIVIRETLDEENDDVVYDSSWWLYKNP